MLNTVHFEPWQRSLFVPPVSSKGKGASASREVIQLMNNAAFSCNLYIVSVNTAETAKGLGKNVRYKQNLIIMAIVGKRPKYQFVILVWLINKLPLNSTM